jgi:dienelactone hydrolase
MIRRSAFFYALGFATTAAIGDGSAETSTVSRRRVVFGPPGDITTVAMLYTNPARSDTHRPLILLFHQAGSNKAEYAPIAPRLVAAGYDALAVDQRAGGDLFAPGNETAKQLHREATFLEAYVDLEHALAFAKTALHRQTVYAWGSSYSASLVFQLAADHSHDVAAVLAFSPGEYFEDHHKVAHDAARVTCPVFIDSAATAGEEAAARAIYDVVPSDHKTLHVPPVGIHASSTLRSDRDPAGAADNWASVLAFLRTLPTAPAA